MDYEEYSDLVFRARQISSENTKRPLPAVHCYSEAFWFCYLFHTRAPKMELEICRMLFALCSMKSSPKKSSKYYSRVWSCGQVTEPQYSIQASPRCGCDFDTFLSMRKSILHIIGRRPNSLVLELKFSLQFSFGTAPFRLRV
jgi:hypothetical protein